MAVVHVGDPGTGELFPGGLQNPTLKQPGMPVKTRGDDGSFEFEYRFWHDLATSEGVLPAQFSALDDSENPGHSDLLLFNSRIDPLSPERVMISLLYKNPDTVVNIQPGEVVRESQVSFREVQIEHKEGLTDASRDALKAGGRHTFRVNTVTYSRSEVKSSFTFSEANMVDGVGEIDNAPTGMTAPSTDKWIKSSKSVREVKSNFDIREEWMFDSNKWEVDLH